MHRLLVNASRLPCLSCPRVPVLPARQSLTCSEASVPSSAAVLCPLEPAVVELFVLCLVFMEPSCSFSLHQPVLDLALLPGTLVPVARSRSFAPLRACAGRTKHVQRRVWSMLANIPIARPCGRSCVFSLRALSVGDSFVLSQHGSDVFLTSPSLHRDSFRHLLLSRRPHRENVLRTAPSHLPSASHARGTDFLSPSRCSACAAVPT